MKILKVFTENSKMKTLSQQKYMIFTANFFYIDPIYMTLIIFALISGFFICVNFIRRLLMHSIVYAYPFLKTILIIKNRKTSEYRDYLMYWMIVGFYHCFYREIANLLFFVICLDFIFNLVLIAYLCDLYDSRELYFTSFACPVSETLCIFCENLFYRNKFSFYEQILRKTLI